MRPRTVAITAGQQLPETAARPMSAPLHASVVAWFDDADTLDAALDGSDFVYTRINAPNCTVLEEAMAALEGAASCVAYATGMAALKALFEAQPLAAGDRVVIAADSYGASQALYKQLAAARGVELVPVLLAAPDAPARVKAARAKLVLAESITNPLLRVPDLPAVADATHAAGGVLAVDATFASPMLQRPLALGADYAVQSTTKWINGHSDAMGGTVSADEARIAPMRAARVLSGAVPGPFEAWLTLRGLRTLGVRMKASCEGARHLASRLSGSPLFDRVVYPGLPTDPSHAVASRVLDGAYGFGGLLALELKGAGRRECFTFLESLRIARPAPSLGDVATLVMHAASASSRRLSPEERAAAGIGENLIRVSVGLEDPDDLADDLLQAAQRARRADAVGT